MSLVYRWSVPAEAVGQPYVIEGSDNAVVASGVVEVGGVVRASLPEGVYSIEGVHAAWAGSTSAVGELDVAASLAAGGGGASVTDGVGAVFFGGENLAVPLTNTYTFSPFVRTDEPPRAPARDDLMALDPEDVDDTTLLVARSGLYDISLNVPLRPESIVLEEGVQPFHLEAVVQVWVAGNSYPPAYDYNNRAHWLVTESVATLPTVFTNITFPQVLLAGDTIQLAIKAYDVAGVTGAIHLNPDITMVCTYRGSVDLG